MIAETTRPSRAVVRHKTNDCVLVCFHRDWPPLILKILIRLHVAKHCARDHPDLRKWYLGPSVPQQKRGDMRFAHSRFLTLGEKETRDRGRRTAPNPFQPPTAALPPGAATRCWRRTWAPWMLRWPRGRRRPRALLSARFPRCSSKGPPPPGQCRRQDRMIRDTRCPGVR